ncbi:MAG: tRNA lysidine(34) synthetase TilS [Gammaproteobacteria bacterium]|nr:tRNA lysidine(34) synthetase TilS [Gammaproteobacteria bacterium]
MSRLLTQQWQERLQDFDHLYVGYSGGLDSTVLLTLLAACPLLQAKITAVHVHHGLSAHADDWLAHCEDYTRRLNVAFVAERVMIASTANLEERARQARYQVFTNLLQENTALVLAHHQEDQAETVLLNILRGAGVDGLSAMPEQRECGQGVLFRPLLHCARALLQSYADLESLVWIEDEMNASRDWSRTYLRHEVMPLLRATWPDATARIAATAQHCQQAKRNLEVLAAHDLPHIQERTLHYTPALLADHDRFSNVLRLWLKTHLGQVPSADHLQHIINNVIMAKEDATPCFRFERFSLYRYRQTLYLEEKNAEIAESYLWKTFPEPLSWSEHIMIQATPDQEGILIPKHARIELRCRQGGERFRWHGQTKTVKALMQDWRIPPWQRQNIPLLYVNDVLISIVGYAISDFCLSGEVGERYTIKLTSKEPLFRAS